MKKKIISVLSLIIIFCSFIFVGCGANEIEKVSKNIDNYYMDIVYNENNTINVSQKVDYINNTGQSLDFICFNLYANAFSKNATINTVSSQNYDKAYYNGKSYGGIEFSSISIDSVTPTFVITNQSMDLLKIDLLSTLKKGDRVTIEMNYVVTIPNCNHRFGYGENAINLANFFPIACVWENGNFVYEGYHYNGDPFYSNVSNFDVNFVAEKDLKVASTGKETNLSIDENNIATHTFRAQCVRDFAIILSNKYNVISEVYNGIEISYYYYNNSFSNRCLKAGVDAVRTYSNLFGDYPYDNLDIVETNFVHGGMEYPNLVYISDNITTESDYLNVIIHEIGHQWWYGIVGSDAYRYGWLDEGMTEYSTYLFYENNSEYNVDTEQLLKNTNNSFVTFVDVYTSVYGNVDTSMNRKLNEYESETEYVYIAYIKGMLLQDALRDAIGNKKYIKALKDYFEKYKYKNATPDDFISCIKSSSRVDLGNFFDSWINGSVKFISCS